ncbi:helix-turn-helix domain-containing protein [Streptomyces chartreusis]|uniref:helix-turn-helix domain-containing protein n=1 Tax=Streptomyces chartreusis TaxID=1969 RepID=UPI0037F3AED5
MAAELGVNVVTVRKWRSRFAAHRLAGRADGPRPGRRKPDLVLTEAERAELTRWARRARTAQFLALSGAAGGRCRRANTRVP